MPYNFDEINLIQGTYTPSMVKINSHAFKYWERALFQRAMSILDITKIPDEWKGTHEDFFKMILFRRGFLAILDTAEYGLIFQPCTLSGYRGIYYDPDLALITNPYVKLPQTEFKIGEECEILKLTPDYMGIWDIITYYAEKLATIDGAVNMAIINSKRPYILGAKNATAAEALKKIFDKANEGQPTVVYNEKILADQKNQGREITTPFQYLELPNVRENYIVDNLLKDVNDILNKFDAAIGIPTIPYEKKERVQNVEANLQQYDGAARSLTWIKTLKASNEVITAKYGPILDFELHYPVDEEVAEDAGETDIDRNV